LSNGSAIRLYSSYLNINHPCSSVLINVNPCLIFLRAHWCQFLVNNQRESASSAIPLPFGHLSIPVSILFRISCLGFRVSAHASPAKQPRRRRISTIHSTVSVNQCESVSNQYLNSSCLSVFVAKSIESVLQSFKLLFFLLDIGIRLL